MTEKEKRNKLKDIKLALQVFPQVVKQNEARGKAHRKLMKAFEPMAKDLARRVKAAKSASGE
jgi:hypothetical protein